MNLHQWALQWGVSAAALADLERRIGADAPPDNVPSPGTAHSEAAAQQQVRLEASELGMRLWRNNVGATYTTEGTFLRYGLANDSAQINAVVKSSDLIGIRSVTCRCGAKYGVFLSREVKHPGWQYSGTPREIAQRRWIDLINAFGGDAAFCTGRGSLLTAPSTK